MNLKQVLLIVLVACVGINCGLYCMVHQPDVVAVESAIPTQLLGNDAAQAIHQQGIPLVIAELGTNPDGYTIRGQCEWTSQDGGETWNVTSITLDDDVTVSYEVSAVLYHELGHVVYGINSTEAQADGYAAEHGYVIVDAYHGIH